MHCTGRRTGFAKLGFVRRHPFIYLRAVDNAAYVSSVTPRGAGLMGSVRFQRIIPRYRLSASDTNDSGLGPAFYDVPVYAPNREQAETTISAQSRRLQDNVEAETTGGAETPRGRSSAAWVARPGELRQGQIVDVYA